MRHIDYSPYIHKRDSRYYVAWWNARAANWELPMTKAEHKATGCSAYFCRSLEGLYWWSTRAQARYQARVRFGLDSSVGSK